MIGSIRRRIVVGLLLVAGCAWLPAWGWAQVVDKGKSALPEGYSCSLCHTKGGELWSEGTPLVVEKDLVGDIHWQKGLRCHDCHGGSPKLEGFKNHRNDPSFRHLRSRADIPAFCGRCHSSIEYMRQYAPSARTDQEAEYWTSGHGKHLKASTKGKNAVVDRAVATCVDCHGGHGILAVNDPDCGVYRTRLASTCARCHSDEQRMAGRTYGGRPLGHQQYEQWRQSVHGRALMEKGDLSAATCNDCHGNHGALPPGVVSVANACGTCHGKISKLFAETRMKHKFEQVRLPGCATCHGNHLIRHPTDEMLGIESGAVCSKCHNPDNPQYGATVAGAEAARTIRSGLDKLRREIDEAKDKIQEAERLGMEVRGPRFDLRQAFDALTNARTVVHSFSPGPAEKALNVGLMVTSSVIARADEALREHVYRRVWLAASLLPILLAVGLLLLTIRSLGPPAASHRPE